MSEHKRNIPEKSVGELKLFWSSDHDVTTTVGELISALSALNPNSFVLTEGCDCWGNVVGVSIQPDGTVLINRDDHAVEMEFESNEYVVSARYNGRVYGPKRQL